jgi:hydrogenase maturation protein HypF
MRLESIIENKINQSYPCSIGKTISFAETIEQIVTDLQQHVPLSTISAKFHNTVISVIYEVVKKIRESQNLNKVVLSGVTFQNKYLLENLENLLINNDFEIFSHKKVPTNDGGIALGQLVIVAKNYL